MIKMKINNIKETFKKMFRAEFIGIQLSRFRNALVYLMMMTSLTSTIALVKLALPALEFETVIIAFGIPIIIITYIIGYYADKTNIITSDALKTNELGQRYLNTSDRKTQEFQIIQTKIIIESINSLTQNKKIDLKKKLQNELEIYVKKWSPK